MKKICVTGGSGGAGNAVIEHLLAQGYDCVNIDIKPPKTQHCPFIEVDMTDYKAVYEAMAGCDAVVHFAGNPEPDFDHWESADRFNNNTSALFNAFNAAQAHGIKRVVWASSETIFGFPFDTNHQERLPVNETSEPQPQGGYALSKMISETLAEQMAKLYGMTFIGLRLSNVLYDDVNAVPSFQKIPGYWEDMPYRKFNLWGYIDSRDTARAARLALEADISGAEVFNIAAKDTLMRQPTKELVDTVMPQSKLDPQITGHMALLDCSKARDLLGFEPDYNWQDVLGLTVDGTRKGDA